MTFLTKVSHKRSHNFYKIILRGLNSWASLMQKLLDRPEPSCLLKFTPTIDSEIWLSVRLISALYSTRQLEICSWCRPCSRARSRDIFHWQFLLVCCTKRQADTLPRKDSDLEGDSLTSCKPVELGWPALEWSNHSVEFLTPDELQCLVLSAAVSSANGSRIFSSVQ